jgi:two-component system chemotaxis sensor kinase CheA
MAEDPYRYFRLEARDLQDQLSAGVLELEKGGDSAAVVQRLLRVAHTLKGAARVVKQQEIAEHAHSIEGALDAIRGSPKSVDRRHIDAILEHIDSIADLFLRLGHTGETGAAQGTKPIPDEGPRTVRADVAEMDAVLDGVSETHALLAGLRTATGGLEQAQHLADVLVAQLAPRGNAEQGRQTTAGPERLFSIAEELRRSFSGLGRNLGSAVDQMDRELRQLRDNAEQLRLVRVGTLFNSLERTARDTAQALSKQVVLGSAPPDRTQFRCSRNRVAKGTPCPGQGGERPRIDRRFPARKADCI